MNLLMLSTDARIFETGSEVRRRMIRYGELFDDIQIVVFMGKEAGIPNPKSEISEVSVYPINARSKFLSLWRGYRTAKRILKTKGNWVVTSQDPFELGFVGWLLAKRFGAPLQLQVHTDFLSPWFATASFKNRMHVWIAKRVLPCADRVRVVSQRVAESIMHKFPDFSKEKIAVLPIIVPFTVPFSERRDEKAIRARYAAYDTIILMASRLAPEKDIALAIRAFVPIAHAHPKILLLIVGDGSEKNKLLEYSITRLPNNVIFEPWTNDLAPYFAAADIFALSSRYEGYGRTVIQAARAGVPVVMTDVGVAGEFVRDGQEGMVVPVGDETVFSRALMRLVEDRELRERMGNTGKVRAGKMLDEKGWLVRFRALLTFKPKLCYVVPAWREGDATHFAYLKEFVCEISKQFDVHLIVERGELPRDSGAVRVTLCDSRFAFVRMLRTELALWRARFRGCRTFYVHYSFFAAYTASLIARSMGDRVFYWNCGEPWKYERSWFRERFERLTYRLVHALVTGTEGLADQYAAHYRIPRVKIKVMPNWITLDAGSSTLEAGTRERLRKELHIPEQGKIVLFAHRLSRRKGAHLLPDVIRAFKDEAVTFLIAGEGPERMNLEVRCRQYGVGDIVRFLGSVPNDELPNYYLLADAFIMPSEEEGFPHVLLEAMAAGVPFVASGVGGVREIVSREAHPYLVPAGDVAAFAARLKAALALTPEERAALARAYMTWVARYDITSALARFREMIL